MKLLSISEYIALPEVKVDHQAVLKQIWENRLPKGVKAEKVGRNYIIKISEPKKKKK